MTEPELRETLNRAAAAAVAALPPDTGFIILAAPFGGAVAQYVSNCERSSAARWMEDTIDRWAKGDHAPR